MKKITILFLSLILFSCGDLEPTTDHTTSEITTTKPSTNQQTKGNITSIEIPDIPNSVEEFVALRSEIATTPEGGAALFVVAMMMYTRDKNLGLPAFTIAIKKDQLSKGDAYKGYAPPTSLNFYLQQLLRKPYIARSYISGTVPANRYQLPANKPYTIKLKAELFAAQLDGNKNPVKVFIESSGADTPRPVLLRKNDKGYWKAANYNSLFLGVKPVGLDEDEI